MSGNCQSRRAILQVKHLILHLLGSKTRTSQDASMLVESGSGGRPAESGCATAGGLGTVRRLASSRRLGNGGRPGNGGRLAGARRRTIDSDRLIFLLVADSPIFASCCQSASQSTDFIHRSCQSKKPICSGKLNSLHKRFA